MKGGSNIKHLPQALVNAKLHWDLIALTPQVGLDVVGAERIDIVVQRSSIAVVDYGVGGKCPITSLATDIVDRECDTGCEITRQ